MTALTDLLAIALISAISEVIDIDDSDAALREMAAHLENARYELANNPTDCDLSIANLLELAQTYLAKLMEPTPIDKIAIALLNTTEELAKATNRPQLTVIMNAIDQATQAMGQSSFEQNRSQVSMVIRLAHNTCLLVDDSTPV